MLVDIEYIELASFSYLQYIGHVNTHYATAGYIYKALKERETKNFYTGLGRCLYYIAG